MAYTEAFPQESVSNPTAEVLNQQLVRTQAVRPHREATPFDFTKHASEPRC